MGFPQDGNQNCRNPNGPENMGSCRMGGGGPMGPGVSMGPMSSEAQTLPSNVISKQAGSMEVTLTNTCIIHLYNKKECSVCLYIA